MTRQDNIYKDQFDLLSYSTNEYKQSVKYIRTQILPLLSSTDYLLDIGAGSGNLSKPLSQEFHHTTIVEPNTLYFSELHNWASENNINLDGYNGDWLNYEFEKLVDLVAIAHVLYFVPPANRTEFIRKAYACVKPGGYLLIILISVTSGITHLYRSLLSEHDYRNMPSIEGVAVNLHAQGYNNLHLQLFDAQINLANLPSVHHLIDFLVIEKVQFDTESNLEKRDRYIDTFLRNDSGLAINSNIGVLSVRKPE